MSLVVKDPAGSYKVGGIGGIIALLVLVLCVVLWFIGKGSSPELFLIGLLALAMLI